MANVVTTQTLEDGRRNLVMLLTGVLDTANEAKTVKIDVSALTGPDGRAALARVAIKRLKWSVSGALKVILDWDATADVNFAALSGEGEMCFDPPVRNNAGAGITGDVELSTVDYASGTETYTVLIEAIKVS